MNAQLLEHPLDVMVPRVITDRQCTGLHQLLDPVHCSQKPRFGRVVIEGGRERALGCAETLQIVRTRGQYHGSEASQNLLASDVM